MRYGDYIYFVGLVFSSLHAACKTEIQNSVTDSPYEGKAKSSWTFLITFIIDVRLFSYFHKCNNGLLSIFM